MLRPKFATARNIFEQPGESSLTLLLVEGFIATVASIFKCPPGGGIVVLETCFGTGEAGRALEGGGGLAGAVASGDQLRKNRVDIVSVGVHAIPEHEDHAEAECRYYA
jgi:hypothetical protein